MGIFGWGESPKEELRRLRKKRHKLKKQIEERKMANQEIVRGLKGLDPQSSKYQKLRKESDVVIWQIGELKEYLRGLNERIEILDLRVG